MGTSTNSTASISVVVPAHNEERFLDEALASLARQSHGNIEIIVVDNGSTDRTPEIVQAWTQRDARFRAWRLERASLHESLRQGFALARSDLIARLDADDIAEPNRLERQYGYLLANPQLGVLGSAATLIDAKGKTIGQTTPCLGDEAIRQRLPQECPFVHSSVMMRRGAYERVGGYRARLNLAEDYDLWLRMSPTTRMANLPDPLIRYRVHKDSITARKLPEVVLTSLCVWAAHVAREAGVPEPFANGMPVLRRALPLLGFSRTEVLRRIYRGQFERWLMTLPLPAIYRPKLRRIAGSAGLGAVLNTGLALTATRSRTA